MNWFNRMLSRIRNFFRKKPKPGVEDGVKDPVTQKEFKYNWGFIVPHTKRAGGAVSREKGINEYEYGLKLVKLLKWPWDTRDKGGVFGAASRLRKKGVNATIEPHKNAFNGKAHGFELLVMKGDDLSGEVARHICEAFQEKYPNRKLRYDNGIKWSKPGDRGYGNLKAAKDAGIDVVILSESFFIDNPKEWITHQEMAKFWRDVLI